MNGNQRQKPVLLYDGDCAFCAAWIERWKTITGDRVDYEPYQTAADRFPLIPRESFAESVKLITEKGEALSGAHAVFRTLAYRPGRRWLLWAYLRIPGVSPVFEGLYRIVARRRGFFYTLTRLLWGKRIEPPAYALARRLFLGFLGIIYVTAFLSLGIQVAGLLGTNGILPVDVFLHRIHARLGMEGYWLFPTLAWLQPTDAFLKSLCWGGGFMGILLILGIAPRLSAAAAWVSYLSLVVVGQTFLSFQCDVLLLETGFLAVLFAPGGLLPRAAVESPPSKTVLWLFRLLLFRLMFFSGFTKVASGDPSWRNLTALTFHFETQPLPTPLAWYAHHFPEWVQLVSCAGMFFIELVMPFFIFAPRRPRFLAAASVMVLMLLISLTGNYTFFNLLTVALCLLLLDDAALGKILRRRPARRLAPAVVPGRLRRMLLAGAAALILFLTCVRFEGLFFSGRRLPAAARAVADWTAPFRLVNHYGLFSVMTNPRYEVIVEGSDDGRTWSEYEFRDKPGAVDQRPKWIAPHQPRLDWQMWFAALGSYRDNPWFVNFCLRLLQGSPEVGGLLNRNPFPEHPPLSIRARLYEYHFSDGSALDSLGVWWKREPRGLYLPPLSLKRETGND